MADLDSSTGWQLAIGDLLASSVLDALPFGVLLATIPGGDLQYTNPGFDAVVGCPPRRFKSVSQFIEEACIHEVQRVRLRKHCQDFEFPPQSTGVIALPEAEVDILGDDGQIRTALHFGLILPERNMAISIFKDVSHAKRYNETLLEYALCDPLTGVSNRRGLQQRWQDLVGHHRSPRVAFLMLDLDGFKPINDVYGHLIGDEVLRAIAIRLQGVLRQADLVCRLGGDEFGILLVTGDDAGYIGEICQRIIDAVTEEIVVEGIPLRISASLGGCFYPEQAKTKRELIQRADMALYQVKKAGGASWGWWGKSALLLDVVEGGSSGDVVVMRDKRKT